MCQEKLLKTKFHYEKLLLYYFFLETEAKNNRYNSHVSECIKIIKCGYNGVFEEKISYNFYMRHEH